jgi:hypothetical protein
MKRIKTHCEACGAALPAQFDQNGVKMCQYCGTLYKDENWVPPSHQANVGTPPVMPHTSPNIFDEDNEPRITHRWTPLVLILLLLIAAGGLLTLFLGIPGKHTASTVLTNNALKSRPTMLNSLPTSSYTGRAIGYANWEINVDPSLNTANNRISIKISVINWNEVNKIFSYKANDIILYDDVGNKYAISLNGCDADAGFLERQISFDANESNVLSSTNYWCSNQAELPIFLGTIPRGAKHLYLQLTNFGVFSKITFVYNL